MAALDKAASFTNAGSAPGLGHHLVGLLRLRHRLADQGLEEIPGAQQGLDAVLHDDHEGCFFIAECGLEAEAQGREESLGLVQVLDRQIEDDLLFHDASSLKVVVGCILTTNQGGRIPHGGKK
jgi:hypothetical protein